MKNLLVSITLCAATLSLQNCSLHDDAIDLNTEIVSTRSNCDVVQQAVVYDIKSIAGLTLGVSANSTVVGAVVRTSPSSGIWIDPSELINREVLDINDFLVICYVSNPSTDSEVAAYSFATDLCEEIVGTNMIKGSIDEVLGESLGIISTDIESF